MESARERVTFDGKSSGPFKLKIDGFLNGFEIRDIIGQYGSTDLPCQNGKDDVVIVFGMDRIESPRFSESMAGPADQDQGIFGRDDQAFQSYKSFLKCGEMSDFPFSSGSHPQFMKYGIGQEYDILERIP